MKLRYLSSELGGKYREADIAYKDILRLASWYWWFNRKNNSFKIAAKCYLNMTLRPKKHGTFIAREIWRVGL